LRKQNKTPELKPGRCWFAKLTLILHSSQLAWKHFLLACILKLTMDFGQKWIAIAGDKRFAEHCELECWVGVDIQEVKSSPANP
jgi:hypothetical protein